uniref:Uncharacterized protein n=1 Tax=Anguilla anguilla TaxID=7936 RepID=A0A0E9TD25_ANGAN
MVLLLWDCGGFYDHIKPSLINSLCNTIISWKFRPK